MFFNLFQSTDKQSLWNKVLVFLFISTYFLDGVTRYKHIIAILMIISAIYCFIRSPKENISLFKNQIFYSVLALSLVLLYSVFISSDLKISFKEFNNSVLKGILLFTIIIPIILRKEKNEDISKLIFISFLSALFLKCSVEIALYFIDYKKGIMPFTGYNHRHISDSMVFLLPALLNLWLLKKLNYKIIFLLSGSVYLFLMLGTLSRGAWLAVLIVTILWLILNKLWKIMSLVLLALALSGVFIHIQEESKPNTLVYKLQQTDSSYRYKNGTQGSAVSLILENPIKGYGYGDDIYHNVYNKRIIDYPMWTYNPSIGPHNLALFIWFGAGIMGLLALIYVYYTIIIESIKKIRYISEPSPYNCYIILLLSLIGFFIIRGNFEQIVLAPLGIITGLLLALKSK